MPSPIIEKLKFALVMIYTVTDSNKSYEKWHHSRSLLADCTLKGKISWDNFSVH